jgi:hypothetical protein
VVSYNPLASLRRERGIWKEINRIGERMSKLSLACGLNFRHLRHLRHLRHFLGRGGIFIA